MGFVTIFVTIMKHSLPKKILGLIGIRLCRYFAHKTDNGIDDEACNFAEKYLQEKGIL